MKIIYIANARIPTEKAHGIQIMEMCHAFAQNDCEVELLVPKRINPIKDEAFRYYGINRSFKLTKLPCIDLIPVGLGKFGFLVQTITFFISVKIYLFLKNYDILYTRDPLAGLFLRDFVLELHNLPQRISRPHIYIWRKAKILVVLTSFIKNTLIKNGISRDKILVAPDGVNLDLFDINISKEEAVKKVNLPADKKIIMYAGSFYLYDWKGIDILLDSIKYFFQKDIVFVLVGGNNEEILKIKERYQFENLILISHVPYGNVPVYLRSADVLVLPNKKGDIMSEEYTSPLKLFEYMTSGAPIVASDLPAIREVLNENNSILVEPNNPEELARGINKALTLENSDKFHKNSVFAKEKVKDYTWDKRVNKIISMIHESS